MLHLEIIEMNIKLLSFNSDKVGVVSSLLCLIHCLVLPAIISIEPLLSEFLFEELHFVEYLFLALSFIAVYFSSKKSPVHLKYIFYIVLGVFTLAILLEEQFTWMPYLAYLGSVCLITAHLVNYYKYQRCAVAPKTKKSAQSAEKELVLENTYSSNEN